MNIGGDFVMCGDRWETFNDFEHFRAGYVAGMRVQGIDVTGH